MGLPKVIAQALRILDISVPSRAGLNNGLEYSRFQANASTEYGSATRYLLNPCACGKLETRAKLVRSGSFDVGTASYYQNGILTISRCQVHQLLDGLCIRNQNIVLTHGRGSCSQQSDVSLRVGSGVVQQNRIVVSV
jgi:hypothetical protein